MAENKPLGSRATPSFKLGRRTSGGSAHLPRGLAPPCDKRALALAPPMTTLGTSCSVDAIFLAVVRDGRILEGFPERLIAPKLMEEGERLSAILGDVERVIGEVQPNNIRILMPERHSTSYDRLAPRVALETLVRLAAGENARTERSASPRHGTFETPASERR
jgi:hypothetical protein